MLWFSMYFCRVCKSIKVYNKAFQPGTRIKEFNIYVSLIAEDIIRCLQRQENTEERFKFIMGRQHESVW